jgi:hypothetical protein
MRWLMLCLPLFGCGPSCEEQGGKVVQHGDFYVWQWIDMQKGIGYMQPYPNYICLKEKNSQ